MADRKISQLIELTSPAIDDTFVVVDASEAVSADKNKKISFQTIHRTAPDGTASAPAIVF